jgi:hypothetical protein
MIGSPYITRYTQQRQSTSLLITVVHVRQIRLTVVLAAVGQTIGQDSAELVEQLILAAAGSFGAQSRLFR